MKQVIRKTALAAAAVSAIGALVLAIPAPPAPPVSGPLPACDVFSAAGYDARHGVLWLEFRNGYAYAYHGVDFATAEGFAAAPRRGEFYNARIRGRHASVRTAAPQRPAD